ncbi:hypothetical protein ACFYTQ_27740 [Nocardia sp. NPDC004068]|uniref:hypothetical protein n=1 Tax=Nocardia sp. NPDC004068 TaxID=3364303 RepID=UPI0036B04CF3
MELQTLSNHIDKLASLEARAHMTQFLKEQAVRLRDEPGQALQIAYEIAGLMATEFARTLGDDDPLDEVLTIAGELEVDPENADELYKELIEKIGQL